MRAGFVIVLVLIAIAGTALLMQYWYRPGAAEYQPEPALTAGDRMFLQSAYEILQWSLLADRDAEQHARKQSVRDFAARAADDHARLLDELSAAARTLDPDFVLTPARTRPTVRRGGILYDRDYLQAFMDGHDRAASAMEEAWDIRDNPSLIRFVSLWRANQARHLKDARQFMEELPKVSSNRPLLLVAGTLCLSFATFLSLRKRLTRSATNSRIRV